MKPTGVSMSNSSEGRTLSINAAGEEDSPFPRWCLTLCDREHPHYPSFAGIHLGWNTRKDGKWSDRTALKRLVRLTLEPEEIESLIDTATTLPSRFPDDVLCDHVHTHGAYSTTRANSDSAICRCIALTDDGGWKLIGYVRETSPLWTQHPWGKRISELVDPYHTTIPHQFTERRLP